MCSQETTDNIKKAIISNLIVISVCILATALLTVFLGRSKYILPFPLIAIVSLWLLIFRVGRMSSRSQEQQYSWSPNYLSDPYINLSIKNYFKNWLVNHPFLIIFGFGFWFSSHFQDLLSLKAMHIIFPSIPVTMTTSDIILAIYILSDFILYLFSRLKPQLLKILKYVLVIALFPIYIYVSLTGAITLIKIVFDYYISGATALLLNDIQPIPILLGTIVMIIALWVVTLWMVKTTNDLHAN